MDQETITFLQQVFSTNKIKLPSKPPEELYKHVIKNNISNIENKQLLPITDLIKTNNPDWDFIVKHPDINIKIIKEHFYKLDFKTLIENKTENKKTLSKDKLCKILVELEKKHNKKLTTYWDLILTHGKININTIIKYQNNFNKDSLHWGILYNIYITDNFNYENQMTDMVVKFLNALTCDNENFNKKFATTCEGFDTYILNIILIILRFSMDYRNFIICIIKIMNLIKEYECKKVKGKGGIINYNYQWRYQTKSIEDYIKVIEKFDELYKHNTNFIFMLKEFSDVLAKQQYICRNLLSDAILNTLIQKSNIFPEDLLYLINNKIITKLPTKPIKYRSHANILFEEYINGNIQGCTPENIGKYTVKEFKKLRQLHPPQGYPNSIYTLDDITLICHNNIETLNKFDNYTLNEIYNSLKKINLGYQVGLSKVVNTFLYPIIFDNFTIPTSRDAFIVLLESDNKFNELQLEFILQNVRLTGIELSLISIQSNLTPYLINKYQSKLDWDVLRFNIIWLMYPPEVFNKLPVYDDDNFWLWASPSEKIKAIEKMNLECSFRIVDNNYIEFYSDNKFLYHNNKIYCEGISDFHTNTKCKNNCILCNDQGLMYAWKRNTQYDSIAIHTKQLKYDDELLKKKIKLFLPSSMIKYNNKTHVISYRDFSELKLIR